MYLFILLSVIDFCLLIEITEVSLDENNMIKIKSQSKKKKKKKNAPLMSESKRL